MRSRISPVTLYRVMILRKGSATRTPGKRNLHVVATARKAPIVERHKSSESRVHRAQVVCNVTRTHERRALRMATKIHQTAHSDRNNVGCLEITIRPRESKAGYRSHDQRWIDSLQRLGSNTDSIQISDGPIFNQDVGVRYQGAECGLTLGGFEIEDDTLLCSCDTRQTTSCRQDAHYRF